MRTILFALLVVLASAAEARAQEAPSPVPSAAQIAVNSTPAIDDTEPAAATRAWLDTVPPDKRARSNAYFEGGYWLLLWNVLVALAISLLVLTTGVSARLRDVAERTTTSRSLQVVLYAVPYLVIVAVLSFPLYVYEHYFREHAYGLATQTFGPWFREQLIAFALQLIFTPLVLVLLYLAFRLAPRTWWMWGTGLAACFLLVGTTFSVYVEPLFNTYKPLADPAISEPVLAMAKANQIPVKQVFEVDASRQSNRVSANVAGFLGTTRIALNDNLLKRCTLPEIREVMAHEMGHYVLNHGGKLVIYFSLFFLVGFGVARLSFNAFVRRWGDRWRVRGIADPAGLPLLSAILTAVMFLLTPIMNTAIRATEREADAFGINCSREPDGMARVALKLGSYRKLDPTPLEEFIFFDHPSGRARIRMAMDWKAAHLPAGNSSAPTTPR